MSAAVPLPTTVRIPHSFIMAAPKGRPSEEGSMRNAPQFEGVLIPLF
jgi:hypothetical protein